MTAKSTETPKNALATQLLRVVFSVYLGVAVSVTGLHMAAEYFDAEEDIYNELVQINETFQPGLAQALWNMNDEQTQKIPAGILNMPVVSRVQVLDESGKIIGDHGDVSVGDNVLQRSFDITYENLGKKTNIGTLIISSSREILISKISYGFAFILVNAVIKSFALWAIFLWFGKHLVSKPLLSLIHAIDSLDFNNLRSSTIRNPVEKNNEISVLAQSFNTMVHNLSDAKEKLNNSHQQLELEIEEHKKARQEIEDLNSALDDRVRLRTHELQEAQQEAEQANFAKTQFLSRMSHELRTPLNEVLGFAQIQERLFRTGTNPRQKDTTKHILGAGNKLLRIVDDILHYSQMEQQDEDIVLETCDVDIAIQEAIHQAEDIHSESKIQINYSPTGIKAKSNLLKLMQIVTHLISNGIKYNQDKGSVNIISTVISDTCVEIAVQDTGVGIAKEHWNVIFSPFIRLEYAEANEIGGVGVGLSISRIFARKMGGDITLSHSSPEGSLFILRLHRAEEHPVHEPETETA
ncbi:hypothetical protein A9Q99_22420 [Gammaproteobacteria bacterium 45_16_T64]|nr:hypothetical protein A9Q99_22420 [Gammaproteobacteria bacterium 45_16_T64]